MKSFKFIAESNSQKIGKLHAESISKKTFYILRSAEDIAEPKFEKNHFLSGNRA